MIKLQNPFVTSGYVAPEYFCDRQAEVGQLLKNIENGNNVTLISTRRMGKSGLIQHCFNPHCSYPLINFSNSADLFLFFGGFGTTDFFCI
jgi:hypothetical protein